ncbi:MAG: metal-dependent transcriptional regulator [Bacteroidota bacterium]|nr:metal-dependent transcriptional regulator [Bacteroidota bacterium]MDP4217769.1 metal-dependent transcriptional regulator [Bacteroidota bacterium]MDP4247255.1 metal-dependent transcriptional regulator [Bacteroidota bacterium]MDP4253819.1 metal-dependent transcriptional regulator [Bacteroidota bacterium]MDP4259503.1 metal-dependent transcriptional regulator [Bacteroidota bacterium]
MKYSASKENHLKSIFHLQHEQGLVTTNALAAALQTRPASVTDMLKKLKEQKLLHYERYKGFRLNNEGRKAAVQVIRKHRLWEYFLVKKLQFGWDEVHEIAEEMEHISSKELVDRLDAFLGYPATDPHGDPIPDSMGRFSQQKQLGLSGVPLNKPVRVSGIAQQTTEMLELLQYHHIHLGTRLEVKKKFPFDDSLEVKIGNRPPVAISAQVAKNILVKEEEK